MTFNSELDFEKALIETLTHKGWNPEIIKYPTEEDLIRNWANILFENNRSISSYFIVQYSKRSLIFLEKLSVFYSREEMTMKKAVDIVEEDYYEENIVCRFRMCTIYENRRSGRCCRSFAKRIR